MYKGEQAGTALNAVLARMYGETKTTNDALEEYGLSMYDSTGKAKNFTQVMGEIQNAMKGMTNQQQNVFLKAVAGTNQLSKFATMINVSATEVNSFTNELHNCAGTSELMAQKMTDNIAGLQEAIGGKIENIKLSLFTAFEPLATGFLKVTDMILNAVDTLLEPIGNVAGAWLGIFTPILDGIAGIGNALIGLVGSAITPFANTFVSLFTMVGGVVQNVVNIIVGIVETVTSLLTPIFNILGTLINMVIQLGTALVSYIGEKISPITNAISGLFSLIQNGMFAVVNFVIDGVNKMIDAVNTIPGVCIENVERLGTSYEDTTESMTDATESFADNSIAAIEGYGTTIESITDANYTNFEEMYEAIQQLDDETYGRLKENAEGYKNEYQLQLDALEEFENDKTREMMKSWEKANKDRAGSLDYYLDKAKHQATVEEALANKTAKAKEEINTKYTEKMTKELENQKKLTEQYNTRNYDNDYKAFAANEEKKTKKYQDELKKRSGNNNSGGFLGGILGGFANGTLSVPQTGTYRVGEFGPETVVLPKGASVTPSHSTSNTHTYNVTIDAHNIKEFNDIVNMCKGYQMTSRMGV